jgi:signal transduction histidine kinase
MGSRKHLTSLFSCYKLILKAQRKPWGVSKKQFPRYRPKRRGRSLVKKSLNWQKKAIVIFAGIIIILSVILTTFAIREAQREKIFREREIAEDLRRSAELIIDQVSAIISETEKRIDKMLPGERVQTQEIGLIEVCSRIMNEEEIVDEIFLIDQEGEVVFPHMKPLFFLAGEEEDLKKTPFTLETNDLFKSAETAEFRTKDYPLAVKTYQNLINRTSDKAIHAVLLNCIGRCYSKSEEPSRAIKAYQQILKQYPSERSPEGTPLGIIAQYQLGKIYCDIQEKNKGIQALFELYSGLLESRWPLSKTQFHFYRNQLKAMLETSLTDIDDLEHKRILKKKWDELKQLEEERLRRASARESFIQKVIPILKAKKPSSGEANRKFHHLSQGIEKDVYLISYVAINEQSILGLRLDSEALIEKLLPLKLETLPLRKDWHIQISDELGNALVARNMTQLKDSIPQVGFSMGFEDEFPPWKVSIYQNDPDIVERQFNRRRNIYILSAVVVVAALFFGGFFWIRSTGKELKLAKLKSDFVSTVSHEFRTPLTSIRYLAELLQRGRVKEEEKKQQYYQTITDESERLSRLIENILDFSKIEAGMKEYQFEETDMGNLARDVASRFQKQVAGKTFRLKTNIANQMPKLSADREAISRALFNLLDNALKYSGENPEITLRAWPDEESIFLEVQDNGRGISKEEQRRVFEKFYRSCGVHESKIKGSGIGLTLVAHIVESHGGEVFLDSDLGKGTNVTVKIPVKQKK